MSDRATLLVTTFNRPELLRLGLESAVRQHCPGLDIIVLNDYLDDETEKICAEQGVRYVFTGKRNRPGLIRRRNAGLCLNVGARLAKGRVFVFSCAEMYHLGENVLNEMISMVELSPDCLVAPDLRDDRTGSFIAGGLQPEAFDALPGLNWKLPFLMALSAERFMAIGGYDEDMIGYGFDDDDIIERLTASGCRHARSRGRAVHLYHPRVYIDSRDPRRFENPEQVAAQTYNRTLFLDRKGTVIRNQGRNWGTCPAN